MHGSMSAAGGNQTSPASTRRTVKAPPADPTATVAEFTPAFREEAGVAGKEVRELAATPLGERGAAGLPPTCDLADQPPLEGTRGGAGGGPCQGRSKTGPPSPVEKWSTADYPVGQLVVIRNLFADAYDDGLIDHNPFSDLQLAHSDGRAGNDVMPETELHRLADAAVGALGPEYGPMWRTGDLVRGLRRPAARVVFTVEWSDVDLRARTVRFRIVKFGRPYTAILLPQVVDELRSLPRRTDLTSVFWSLRGRQLRQGSHFYAWDKIRQAAGMPELDFHDLRHWCGHHFYLTLGFSAEEAGAQLGHKDGREIVRTYGHGRHGALERLHRGTERPAEIRYTSVPHAAEGSAS